MSTFFAEYAARVEQALTSALLDPDVPEHLAAAMRHSTLDGGKRIRALLCYASGLSVDAELSALDTVACAHELVHAYSLIHDDLPAMDDDDLRRGKPTCHIAFDEATAILAGDALSALAFALINDEGATLSDAQARRISAQLATAAGPTGMVGGQMLDILATHTTSLDRVELENIHRRKTGALIRSAVVCGALTKLEPNDSRVAALHHYADCLGLAFQVIDDVLDVEVSTEQLGKPRGADAAMGKSTYPDLLGLQASRKLAENLCEEAIASVAVIGDNIVHLTAVAEAVVRRGN